MLWRDMRASFVMTIVEELLDGAYEIDESRDLLDIDLTHQPLAVLLRPEGFGPIADVAEVYEREDPPEISRIEKKAIATECLMIHALIVRRGSEDGKGAANAALTCRPKRDRPPELGTYF
jgi:hypothetical protein